MKKIAINRSSEYVNALRDYKIYADNQKIGAIGNGEIKTFEIPENAKQISAKIDWCGSNSVEISSAENQNFEIKGQEFLTKTFLISFVGIILHLICTYFFPDIYWPSIFIIPFFLILIFHLTINRKNYLTIRKI